MSADPVRAIADAVLYEGYLLWPYRRSALKNQRRWTFGGVHPPDHAERHPDDRDRMRAECLLRVGRTTRIDVRVRFLHVVEIDDGTETWEEAVEREVAAEGLDPAVPARLPLAIPAGGDQEDRPGGPVARRWRELRGTVTLASEPLAPWLTRIAVDVHNETPGTFGSREDALPQTLCSTHAVLRAAGGAWVSLTDPPSELRTAAAGCRNQGVWPVLAGEPGSDDTLLASPIILEDHPRVAPESPGDLFDGGEIDQMLVLNILALTDAEREEMRAADPRAREILERTEALTTDELMRLNGAIREWGAAR